MRPSLVEFEVLPGLVNVAADEIEAVAGPALVGHLEESGDDGTRLVAAVTGDLGALLRLRTVTSVYLIERFAAPRPRALLGDEARRRITSLLRAVQALHPAGTFRGLRISAAGSDSTVYRRLGAQLAEAARLPTGGGPGTGDTAGPGHTADTGHTASTGEAAGTLLIRVRRSDPGREPGWDVLVQLTPRPLGSRAWRVAHHPAALHATLASAMVRLAEPQPDDRVLNLMAGSGTLVIEWAAISGAARLTGLDSDAGALDMAVRNASGTRAAAAAWVRGDATAAPFPSEVWDCILADLPYGHRSGSHAANEAMHPALLQECGRLLTPGGRLVVITHELRRFERALDRSGQWRTARRLQVFQGGHHPCIWVLRRAP